jgi:hypothetical protein
MKESGEFAEISAYILGRECHYRDKRQLSNIDMNGWLFKF